MYDLGFPTDAIEAVNHLYTQASTQICLPSGGSTDFIPVERGTIQGDTLSPFLFLLYLGPLLRWLHVGRGYNHACADSHDHSGSLVSLKHMHLNNTLSNGAFADVLICLFFLCGHQSTLSFLLFFPCLTFSYTFCPSSPWLFPPSSVIASSLPLLLPFYLSTFSFVSTS